MFLGSLLQWLVLRQARSAVLRQVRGSLQFATGNIVFGNLCGNFLMLARLHKCKVEIEKINDTCQVDVNLRFHETRS